MTSRVLLIGTPRWAATLRRNFELYHAASGAKARAYSGGKFGLVVVDAASMHISGERICRDMRTRFPDASLLLISAKCHAGGTTNADLVLNVPLNSRRLNSTAWRLLSAVPQDCICCGPFSLNRSTRVLRAHGKQVQLSPKLAGLIEFMLCHPNQTLLRARIMQAVWKTDFLGDTRTLNVHIRLARKVLEVDPQNPAHLKTVRGQGYRLEIATKKEPAHSAGLSSNRIDSLNR